MDMVKPFQLGKLSKTFAMVLIFGFLLSINPISAQAEGTTVTVCIAYITTLEGKVDSVTINGKNPVKTRAGLLKKLAYAKKKLNEMKDAGAIAKMNDFIQKVGRLVPKKMDSVDANELMDDAEDIIDCINYIGS